MNIRFAMLGAGRIGQLHAIASVPGVDLAAVAEAALKSAAKGRVVRVEEFDPV